MACVLMDSNFIKQHELIFSLLLRYELLIEIFIDICVYIGYYIYTYVSVLLRPGLILLREMSDSKTRAGNTEDKSEIPQ